MDSAIDINTLKTLLKNIVGFLLISRELVSVYNLNE